jgi:hypothetical protein
VSLERFRPRLVQSGRKRSKGCYELDWEAQPGEQTARKALRQGGLGDRHPAVRNACLCADGLVHAAPDIVPSTLAIFHFPEVGAPVEATRAKEAPAGLVTLRLTRISTGLAGRP